MLILSRFYFSFKERYSLLLLLVSLRCDRCHNDINGIRFDCVHCPTLTFCEKCEQQATLEHSRKNQSLKQQQHVFKLIMTPE